MIIKGGSRAGPKQLARHLLRRDTNETVELLHCDYSPRGNLKEAFCDMQALTTVTRGTKGLYHANIDPEARYDMTADQWRHAADVLEAELGLTGQPRALVLHVKNDRPHLHVVWARTDLETGKLRTDSYNYLAHERASLQLEREFGHEHTPGVHAKKDREAPRPTQPFNRAAWQKMERTGIDPRDRKAEITALYQAADSGQAFKAALQEAGYLLAQGDRRGFLVVDGFGEPHSLARQINGARTREIREKLADLDPDTLPNADMARAASALRHEMRLQRPPDPAQERPADAPRQPQEQQEHQGPEQQPEPAEEPEHLRRQRDNLAALPSETEATRERQQRYWEARWQAEIDQTLETYRRQLAEERRAAIREYHRGGGVTADIKRYWQALQERFSPGLRARRQAREQEFLEGLERHQSRQFNERRRELEEWRETKRDHLAAEHARGREQLAEFIADQTARLDRELDRYRALEAERRERERQRARDRARDGPDPGRRRDR